MSEITPSATPSADDVMPAQDYDTIEAAVMETARGRWFLQEYAKRNRNANTDEVLSAVQSLANKLELPQTQPAQSFNPMELKISLGEMQQAIELTRHEIFSLIPQDGNIDPFAHSTGELDMVVDATEKATQNILANAEQVQETAWLLRENNADTELCDKLDMNATEIYMACSFQDLTGQRIRKVIQALHFIEERINGIMHVWMKDEHGEQHSPLHTPAAPWMPNTTTLANGPSAPGEGLDQDDVDAVLSIKSHSAAAPAEISEVSKISNEAFYAVAEKLTENSKQMMASSAIPNDTAEDDDVVWAKHTQPDKTDFKVLTLEEKYALFV